MGDERMPEAVARSIGRNRGDDGNGNGIAGAATSLRFYVHDDDPDLVISAIANKIDAALREFGDEITENLVLGIVRPIHDQRNFHALRIRRRSQ